jgi:hypothetical protein
MTREGAIRWFLAILLLTGASACQAPPSSLDEGTATAPDYRDFELSDLVNDWFRSRIASRCASEGCARALVLEAFDESGQAGDNCPPDTGLSAFGECVVFGSFARELLVRHDPALVGELNWLAPRSSITFAFDIVANTVVAGCYGAEQEHAEFCYRLRMAESLGLTEYSASICGPDHADDWKRCMIKEYLSNELSEASARI